jgi:hypothetical protein
MPPKAITSSVFLGLEDGVGDERGVAAIHGAPLSSSVPFLRPASEDAAGFGLMNPASRVIGERVAVSFAVLRGEDGVFCPCRTAPEKSEEVRKDLAASALDSGDAAEDAAPAARLEREGTCVSTAAGSLATAEAS